MEIRWLPRTRHAEDISGKPQALGVFPCTQWLYREKGFDSREVVTRQEPGFSHILGIASVIQHNPARTAATYDDDLSYLCHTQISDLCIDINTEGTSIPGGCQLGHGSVRALVDGTNRPIP